jgi:hypothetical protein
VLVGEPLGFERRLELGVVDLLEEVLELAVVHLENRVLGGEIHRVVAAERVGEAGAREARDGGCPG